MSGLIFNGNGDVIRAVDGSLTIEGLDFGGGNIEAGIGTFTTLNVTGVLTYEDVKNVDSVGIVTARAGLHVQDDSTFYGVTSGRNVVWDKSENSLEFKDYTYAKFGVDDDLTISSLNTHSLINNKTGELRIPSAGNVRILKRHDESSAFAAEVANFNIDGAVELFNAGSKKFETSSTGIKVTGTKIEEYGSGEVQLLLGSTNAGGAGIYFDGDSDGNFVGSDYSWIRHTTGGDLEYVVDNPAAAGNHIFKTGGSSEKLRISSTGLITQTNFNGLGIHISGGQDPTIRIQDTDGTNQYVDLAHNSGNSYLVTRNNTSHGGFYIYSNNGSTTLSRLRIDSTGNILVNGADNYHADADDLVLKEKSGGNVGMTFQNTGTGYGVIYFADSGAQHSGRIQYDHSANSLDLFTDGSERLSINSSGQVLVGTSAHWGSDVKLHLANSGNTYLTLTSGTSSNGVLAFSDDGTERGAIDYDHNGDHMLFKTSAAERMRITSTGQFLIGTDGVGSSGVDGIVLYKNGNGGITIRNNSNQNGNIFFSRATSGTGEYEGYIQYQHAQDTMVIGTGHVTRITIDANGKLGLHGYGTPTCAVSIKLTGQVADGSDDASDWGGAGIVNLYNTDGGTTGSEVLLLGSQTSGVGQLSSGFGFGRMSSSNWGTYISFKMHPDGTSNIDSIMERARFTPAGYFLVQGNASNYHDSNNTIFHQFNNWQQYTWVLNCRNWGSGYGIRVQTASNSSGREAFYVYDTAGSAGKAAIYMNGTYASANSTYGGLSDIKLKENIVDASSQWDDIKALKVRNFNFKKDDPSEKMLGLIAQEAETVCPSLVWDDPDKEEDSDGKMTETGEVTKQLKYSILYMKAVKCLQEAQARIETLETKVAALEGS